jgi:hypothetical protein
MYNAARSESLCQWQSLKRNRERFLSEVPAHCDEPPVPEQTCLHIEPSMNRFRIAVLVGVFAVCIPSRLPGQNQPAAASTPQPPAAAGVTDTGPTTSEKQITAYTLPPDLYEKAHDRSRIHFRLALIGFLYGLAVLWLILRWKLAAKYRDWPSYPVPGGLYRAFFSPHCCC